MSAYLAVFGRGLHGRGVCALQCRDIDLNTRTLYIRSNRSTEDPGSKIGTPKISRSARDERILSQLVRPVRLLPSMPYIQHPTVWLFPAALITTDPIRPKGLRGMYAKASATVRKDDLRFHDFKAHGTHLDGARRRHGA
jgi:integrase